MKLDTAHIQSFSEHAPSFNYRKSMDTKGPITHFSQNKSYLHVIVDAFSHFVVTVPIKSNNAKTAVKTYLHHWIVKFGPLHTSLLIVDPNILTLIWHIFVHLWVLYTPLEPLTPLY